MFCRKDSPNPTMKVTLTDAEIAQVQHFMCEACGINLEDKKCLINSKMGMLCFTLNYDSFALLWHDAFAKNVEGAKLRQKIIDALTTNYTYFYREEHHFEILRQLLLNGKLPCHNDVVRVWSAGCASGQEPYNLAMVLDEARREGLLKLPYEIVASDISCQAIEDARCGHYSLADYVRLPQSWRSCYCYKIPGGCEIKRSLRERIDFRRESVLNPGVGKQYDFVFCRNLIIYFDKDSIAKLCDIVRDRVMAGGYLFLGHSEIMNELPGFTYVEPSVYRRNSQSNER